MPKNIIITESKLRLLWDKLLNEVVGVPDNILETGEEIYEDILIEIDLLNKVKDIYKLNIQGNYRISDVTFTDLNVDLVVVTDDNLSEPTLISMGFGLASEMKQDDFRLKHSFGDDVHMQIQIGFDEKWDLKDLRKFFVDNKVEILSSLSHELKHSYDFRKQGHTSSANQAKYKTYSEVKVGIPTVDKFIFGLYFIHSIENLVRPVELASQLKSHNITRKEFYDFFTKSKLFEFLKSLQTETYDNFREELKQFVPQIRDHFEQEGDIDDVENKTDDEIIDIVLDKTYKVLGNTSMSQMFEMLLNSPLEIITGFVGPKDKFFRKFIREITKYEDGPTFFKSQFEFFRIISTKMIKKLAKLFSIVPVNKVETNESKSIYNWEAFHRAKKTKPIFNIKRKTTT